MKKFSQSSAGTGNSAYLGWLGGKFSTQRARSSYFSGAAAAQSGSYNNAYMAAGYGNSQRMFPPPFPGGDLRHWSIFNFGT